MIFFKRDISSGRYLLPNNNADCSVVKNWTYSVFQGFSKAKFAYGDSILRSSQFLILPQLPQKMKLTSKVVKIDKIIITLLPTI